MKNKYLLLIGILISGYLLSIASLVSAQPSSGDTPYTCYNSLGEQVTCPPVSVFNRYEIGKCYEVLVSSRRGTTTVTEIVCPNAPSSSDSSGSSGIPDEGIPREELSGGECEPEGDEELNSTNCGIIRLVVNVTNFLSAIAGIALVASLMISGYLYMTARDNAGQIEKAKSRIIQTLLALVLFIFMYALLNFLIPGGLGLS